MFFYVWKNKDEISEQATERALRKLYFIGLFFSEMFFARRCDSKMWGGKASLGRPLKSIFMYIVQFGS